MPVSPALTAELKKVVLWMEDDLRERIEQQAQVKDIWVREHAEAVERERTAMSWQAWRDDRVTQAAVAWVLTTVFVRFCEDNRLLTPVWISGPEAHRQEALDAELAYFRAHPEHTSREWLERAITHLRKVDATRSLVESHSPLWTVSPSGRAAQRLVNFWRETGEDGSLVWDFTDSELSTRFLGDLYQDLSDYAKKTYALLQTPEFVEEFILDQTMEPALAERPLEGFTLIDPTCGSGHFLLGAFTRLNNRWATHAPGLNVRARVAKALESIHGVDLNPFAIAIARFRLIVAALQACGEASLESAPNFPLNLAAGDSLLHGQHQTSIEFDGVDFDSQLGGFTYATEDLALLRKILTQGRYDVVVGNPPYITVKDSKLNTTYRGLYESCYGTYALSVPFMERFFQLAKHNHGDRPSGWTGQITSNSFMKRGFGAPLVEKFLTRVDVSAVIDSEGAWIPGHNMDGTPTVIIIGRNQLPKSTTVRLVRGKNLREGKSAGSSGKGPLWQAITKNIGTANFENEWIEVCDSPRSSLAKHPWILSSGGRDALIGHLDRSSVRCLAKAISPGIGRAVRIGADDVYVYDRKPARTREAGNRLKPYLIGEDVRDFMASANRFVWYPYIDGKAVPGKLPDELWPYRTTLKERGTFAGNMTAAGRAWWEYMQHTASAYTTPLSIAFSNLASHNHFGINRGETIFNAHAPVIKLPATATLDDCTELLATLNSSVTCFWMRENSQPKGGGADTPWTRTFEFTGTMLNSLPLPVHAPRDRARELDKLAREKAAHERGLSLLNMLPTREHLEHERTTLELLKGRLIAEQEELDWDIYAQYGLTSDSLTYTGDDLPGLTLGQRAFEINLARAAACGQGDLSWFTHQEHRSEPITELPAHWPAAYRELVQRRLNLIESDKFIQLLEKPEHKRRWASEPWDKQVERALRGWLLDKLEDRKYWFDSHGRPAPTSIGQLADQVSRDPDLVSVLELWSGVKDQGVAKTLTALLTDEAVPYLAAYRLKDSGLRKREAWEHTWDLQRREDAGEHIKDIPVPPKYRKEDFRKQPWWHHRGKLDVPKERFILYPDASRDTDPTLLLGWAGWDHAQQAIALAMIIDQRTAEGTADSTLVPLVAGLAELQPWIVQWHNEVDPLFGVNMADFCAEQLRERAARLGQTIDQIRAWRPAPPRRGRKAQS